LVTAQLRVDGLDAGVIGQQGLGRRRVHIGQAGGAAETGHGT
nr:hypothetical protein [Tanacetum cinerariifolium]